MLQQLLKQSCENGLGEIGNHMNCELTAAPLYFFAKNIRFHVFDRTSYLHS